MACVSWCLLLESWAIGIAYHLPSTDRYSQVWSRAQPCRASSCAVASSVKWGTARDKKVQTNVDLAEARLEGDDGCYRHCGRCSLWTSARICWSDGGVIEKMTESVLRLVGDLFFVQLLIVLWSLFKLRCSSGSGALLRLPAVMQLSQVHSVHRQCE